MNLQIVTLEITTLIIAFDHYDSLLSGSKDLDADATDAYQIIKLKGKQHLDQLFADDAFFNEQQQLIALPEIKSTVKARLTDLKANEVHAFIERMEKLIKKLKKLYRSNN